MATLGYKTCGDCGYHWADRPEIDRCQVCHSPNIQRTTMEHIWGPEWDEQSGRVRWVTGEVFQSDAAEVQRNWQEGG